jgi:hypothetical protein
VLHERSNRKAREGAQKDAVLFFLLPTGEGKKEKRKEERVKNRSTKKAGENSGLKYCKVVKSKSW